MKKIILPLLIISLFFMSFAFVVQAGPGATPSVSSPGDGSAATPTIKIEDIVKNITTMLFNIFILAAVLMIIVAAFTFLFSGGSADKIGKARGMLVMAIVAIVVALLAKFVVPMVQDILGKNIDFTP
jgi:magnesium-transporting ATPase (P-type)